MCEYLSAVYEDVIKRVLYHEDEIRKLEKLVKNDNSRNSILVSHEQYLSLFNPDNRDVTLKRTN